MIKFSPPELVRSLLANLFYHNFVVKPYNLNFLHTIHHVRCILLHLNLFFRSGYLTHWYSDFDLHFNLCPITLRSFRILHPTSFFLSLFIFFILFFLPSTLHPPPYFLLHPTFLSFLLFLFLLPTSLIFFYSPNNQT